MSQSWISTLRKTFENAPLASNVAFSFLLVLLEKLVDMDFVCPCKENKHQNASFVSGYFIIPAFLAFVLMIGLHKLAEPKISFYEKGINCIIPAIVWLNLLLFDGRYVACGMTSWSGKYVTADKAALKWCETDNSTLYETRLKDSKEWYFHSQCAGLSLTLGIAIVGLCVFTCNCEGNTTGDPPADLIENLNKSLP